MQVQCSGAAQVVNESRSRMAFYRMKQFPAGKQYRTRNWTVNAYSCPVELVERMILAERSLTMNLEI
jgi:hypothetical protein